MPSLFAPDEGASTRRLDRCVRERGRRRHAPQRLDLLLIDDRGRLHHGWHDAPRGWGYWDDLGGGFLSGATAGSLCLTAGRPQIYAISSCGGLCHTSYEPAAGRQGWVPVDDPGTRVLTMGVAAAVEPDGGRWLASVDAGTRHPLIRYFDIHQGWGPWTEVAQVPVKSVPAITTTAAFHAIKGGKPVSHSVHVFWLPQAAEQDSQLIHTSGRMGSLQSVGLQLSGGNPIGVAATSWGGQRLDCAVAQEFPDGDRYRVAALDHLWSDDAGGGFGIEALQIP